MNHYNKKISDLDVDMNVMYTDVDSDSDDYLAHNHYMNYLYKHNNQE